MEEYKDIVLDVDVNAAKRDCVLTGKEFCSYDQQSARIVINISKNGQPIQIDNIKCIRFFLASSDGYGRIIKGMQYQTNVNHVVDGRATVVLPDEYLSYSGRAVVHIYIIFKDGPTNDAGQSFLINFKKSAIDQSEAGNVAPNYFQNFDDILSEVQYVANEKIEEINSMGIDIGEYVKDYLAESPDIATKDYVNAKADISDNVLMAWLFLESEGE